MNTETDDTTGKLIHYYQHPMAFEANRLTSEQIDAPKAVFHVANESEPGRATATGFWTIVFDQYTPDDMLINLDAKSFRDDQGDPRAVEAPIAAFEFNNGTNEWLGWSFRPRLRSVLWREQPTVLASHQVLVKFQ